MKKAISLRVTKDEENEDTFPRYVENPGEEVLRTFKQGQRVQLRKRSKQPTYIYVRTMGTDNLLYW